MRWFATVSSVTEVSSAKGAVMALSKSKVSVLRWYRSYLSLASIRNPVSWRMAASYLVAPLISLLLVLCVSSLWGV